MSLTVKMINGDIEANFVGIPIEGVAIGEHEIPLEHFCFMARHFLEGGWFGWGGETPECVNTALTLLFGKYKRTEDGKWIRKSLEELKKEMKDG